MGEKKYVTNDGFLLAKDSLTGNYISIFSVAIYSNAVIINLKKNERETIREKIERNRERERDSKTLRISISTFRQLRFLVAFQFLTLISISKNITSTPTAAKRVRP